MSNPSEHVEPAAGGPTPIAAASTSATAFVDYFPRGPVEEPTRITSFADFARIFGPVHTQSAGSYAVQQFFLNGGSVAWVVRVNLTEAAPIVADGLAGSPAALRTAVTSGLDRLSQLPMGAVNLLCLPVAATLGGLQRQLLEDAVAFCESRHAFLIVDPPVGPAGASVSAVTTWCAGGGGPPASRHAAVYWPRLLVSAPDAPGLLQEIGPSGTVAGIMARIDASVGVWKAPAGTGATIHGADIAVSVNDGERGELSRAGINAVRSLPSVGTVVWGARTLAPAGEDSTWKFVPVRRTALFLEHSVLAGLQHAAFEPNDERLWSQVRLTVGDFLQGLFRRQAFQGTTPSDAYFVRCGQDTMTQTDIDQGALTVVVGFAPLTPAEFVVLQIQVRTAQEPPD